VPFWVGRGKHFRREHLADGRVFNSLRNFAEKAVLSESESARVGIDFLMGAIEFAPLKEQGKTNERDCQKPDASERRPPYTFFGELHFLCTTVLMSRERHIQVKCRTLEKGANAAQKPRFRPPTLWQIAFMLLSIPPTLAQQPRNAQDESHGRSIERLQTARCNRESLRWDSECFGDSRRHHVGVQYLAAMALGGAQSLMRVDAAKWSQA
jgi:hypothetical protein